MSIKNTTETSSKVNYKSTLTSENFESVINDIITLEKNPVIAVAVSGGADSLALTILLKQYLDKINGRLVALTVNHNIRKESLSEAENVHSMLTKMDIEHHILNYEGTIPKNNIMEKARNLRYNLICEFCIKHNIINLAVAHHFDDQVETFLIRMDRGSGIEGLSSIPFKSIINGIRLFRPLLSFRKNEVYSFLNEKKIKWIEDPTNKNTEYKRNNIRMLLDNLNQLDDIVSERIFKTSHHIARGNFVLNNLVNTFFSTNTQLFYDGKLDIDLSEYLKLESEIALRVLSQSLQTIGCNTKPPRFKKLNNLYNSLISTNNIFNKCTLYGCVIDIENDKIKIYRDYGLINNDKIFFTEENNFSVYWDNRFIINIKLSQNEQISLTSSSSQRQAFDKNNKVLDSCFRSSDEVGAAAEYQEKLLSCNSHNTLNKDFFVTNLQENDRIELKNIGVDFMKNSIGSLYSLPIIKTTTIETNTKRLEKIIAVPHINHYTTGVLSKDVYVEFFPSKPLTKVIFDV